MKKKTPQEILGIIRDHTKDINELLTKTHSHEVAALILASTQVGEEMKGTALCHGDIDDIGNHLLNCCMDNEQFASMIQEVAMRYTLLKFNPPTTNN